MLFCPRSHLWIRLHRVVVQSGLVAARAAWRAEIGLTSRGLEDVGTVHACQALAQPGRAVRAQQPLLHVEWDGHTISDGDELYHTTWSTMEGRTTLLAPVEGTLLFLRERVDSIEPETCLAEIRVDKPGLNAASGLVNEEMYLRAVDAAGPGKFGSDRSDDDQKLKYTRYG